MHKIFLQFELAQELFIKVVIRFEVAPAFQYRPTSRGRAA